MDVEETDLRVWTSSKQRSVWAIVKVVMSFWVPQISVNFFGWLFNDTVTIENMRVE
jgi:hypothetical protein